MIEKKSVLQTIKLIISEQVGVSEELLGLDSEPSKISTWDSLANTMIYLEIKKIVDTELKFEEYLECKNIGELLQKLLESS